MSKDKKANAKASTSSHALKDAKSLIDECFEDLIVRTTGGAAYSGIGTGFYQLDECTCGLQKGDLIILASRPSMGKTSFVSNIAVNTACMQAVPTLFISLELSRINLISRMLCSWGKVNTRKFKNGRMDDADWARIYEAANAISPSPLFIVDTPRITVSGLENYCRDFTSKHPGGIIIIDCLQLLHADKIYDTREQEITNITINLKSLAKELSVPIIATSHINRRIEDRNDKRPLTVDLRESGAIEQIADLILFIYRDSFYHKSNDSQTDSSLAEIIIAKHSNGPTGFCKLRFFPESTSFVNTTDTAKPFSD